MQITYYMGSVSSSSSRRLIHVLVTSTLLLLVVMREGAFGIRFVIENKEECLSYKVDYDGDTVYVSFVVIKPADDDYAAAYWLHYNFHEGVDLLIRGPSGEKIHDFHGKISEQYEFMAPRRGIYGFCFNNRSPFYQALDFDVNAGHFLSHHQHAKDENFNPVLEEISKLEASLKKIQLAQHWLEAQTQRQELVNEAMSKRAVQKAIFESLVLIGASFLQVYVLQRLFDHKLLIRTTSQQQQQQQLVESNI